jgi:hypothetical protein
VERALLNQNVVVSSVLNPHLGVRRRTLFRAVRADDRSNVLFGEHLGGAFVQLFSTPHIFEARQQVIGP